MDYTYALEIHNKTTFFLHFKERIDKVIVTEEDQQIYEKWVPLEIGDGLCGLMSGKMLTDDDDIENEYESDIGKKNDEGRNFDNHLDVICEMLLLQVEGVDGVEVTKHKITISHSIFYDPSDLARLIVNMIYPLGNLIRVDLPK